MPYYDKDPKGTLILTTTHMVASRGLHSTNYSHGLGKFLPIQRIPESWNMDLGGFVLGSLILYLKGMRRMMFQLSGFYYKRFSGASGICKKAVLLSEFPTPLPLLTCVNACKFLKDEISPKSFQAHVT